MICDEKNMLRYLNWNHKLRKILHVVLLLAQGKATFFQIPFHSDIIHLSIAVHGFQGPDLASSVTGLFRQIHRSKISENS